MWVFFALVTCVNRAEAQAPASAPRTTYEAPPEPVSDAPETVGTAGEGDYDETGEGDDWSDDDPVRAWFSFGAGSSLRLARNRDFAQDAFAPSYLDAFGAVILPASGFFRHGIGLGFATNLAADGSVLVGLDAFEQAVLTPSYFARLAFADAWIGTIKAGVPWVVSPKASLGAEVSLGAAWLLLSGFGVYAEAGVSMFVGGEVSIHPLASGELGFVLDYEVLP